MRASLFVWFVLGAAVLVSACTANAQTPPLDGKYSYTLTKEALANQNLDGGQLCARGGALSLSSKGDRWSMEKSAPSGCFSGNMKAEGTWKISGDQMLFHADQARYQPIKDGICDQDFTSAWSYDGKELRFKPVKDNCALRVAHFTVNPWAKAK